MATRRALITGLISFVAAPAIVRAANLMPVKAMEDVFTPVEFSGFYSYYPLTEMTEEMVQLLRKRMEDAYIVMAKNLSENLYGDFRAQSIG